MGHRLAQIYRLVGVRDLVEIAILAIFIYFLLRLLGKTRGSGLIRGLAVVAIGLFLVAQVVVASFDLTELSKVLDYLLTTVLVGLIVIFQPELRRGLTVLGRYRLLRYFGDRGHPLADVLADAAEALSRDCIGGLIVVQRETPLDPYAESGEMIDAVVSVPLLRTIFSPKSPLHDGAVIVANGRIRAAGCQLPLGQQYDGRGPHLGMRHRAALSMSEETDAVLVVVSEETGRISLASGGQLQAHSRELLSRGLAELLNQPVARRTAA